MEYLEAAWWPFFDAFNFNWYVAPFEMNSVLLHIRPNKFGHLLIKSTKQNWAHHDSGVNSQTGQKSSAFQRNIRGSHAQGFARMVLQRENVIRGDAIFFGTRNIRIARSTACGQEYVPGSYIGDLVSPVCCLSKFTSQIKPLGQYYKIFTFRVCGSMNSANAFK